MKKLFLFLALCAATSSSLFALSREQFKEREDSLKIVISRVLEEQDSSKRAKLHKSFEAYLEQTLRQDSAFFYNFDQLPLYSVASPNGMVRVITWSIENAKSYSYFGFVLVRKGKFDPKSIPTKLRENRRRIDMIEEKSLRPDQWIGATYTELIERHLPNSTTPIYTLLGNSPTKGKSNKKVIEALRVSGNTSCSLGAPIFKRKKLITSRVIFEYNAEAEMNLRYQDGMEMIVLSNLVPPTKKERGQYAKYAPSGTFDGFKYEDGKWVLYENVQDPKSIQFSSKRKK